MNYLATFERQWHVFVLEDAKNWTKNACVGVGTASMVSEKKNFILSQGKYTLIQEKSGEIEIFYTTDLILCKAGRNIWGHHHLNDIFT